MSAEPRLDGRRWLALFLPYANRLRRYVAGRLSGSVDVDDVTQEVWLRLLRNDPKAVEDPVRYLLGTARHVVADFHEAAHVARGRFVTGSAELDQAADTIEDPVTANVAERVLTQRALELALAQLPDTQALVLTMHEFQGLSRSEVALGLDMSIHTVDKHLRDAKCNLRKLLGNEKATPIPKSTP